MRNFLKGLWKDESGAAAIEYALILGVIAAGIALFAGDIGEMVSETFSYVCNDLTTNIPDTVADASCA